MDNTQLQKAIEAVKAKFPRSLVEHYRGYVVIDQTRSGLESKMNCIDRGDTRGFMRVEDIVKSHSRSSSASS